MIPFLEGSFLDLSPAVWALIMVVALILVEVFQLGPHIFSSKPIQGGASKLKGNGGPKESRIPRPKPVPRRRKRAKTPTYINVNGPCAIFFCTNDEDFKNQIPVLNTIFKQHETQPWLSANSQGCERVLGSYAQAGAALEDKAIALGDKAIALGDKADEVVLDDLTELWKAREKSGATHAFFFSLRMPSMCALQKLVNLLNYLPDADKVDVAVLYQEDQEDEQGLDGREKEEYLIKHNISLDRIDQI